MSDLQKTDVDDNAKRSCKLETQFEATMLTRHQTNLRSYIGQGSRCDPSHTVDTGVARSRCLDLFLHGTGRGENMLEGLWTEQ